MKGRSELFNKIGTKLLFKLNIQLFASKYISDVGIKIQSALTNQKLKNLVGELYRKGAIIGDESAMAAASMQVSTGILVGGRDHVMKIQQRITNLNNIIKNQKLNVDDLKYANKLMSKMKKSLKGEY